MIRCKQLQDASVILCLIYDNTLHSHENIIFIYFLFCKKTQNRQRSLFLCFIYCVCWLISGRAEIERNIKKYKGKTIKLTCLMFSGINIIEELTSQECSFIHEFIDIELWPNNMMSKKESKKLKDEGWYSVKNYIRH